MTLEQYLNEQYADPRAESGSLVWMPSTLSDKQRVSLIQSAGINPYVIVTWLDENERSRTHDDHGMIDQIVFLNFYQDPVNSETPDVTQLHDVYRVITSTLGKQVTELDDMRSLYAVERGPTMIPPSKYESTKGLYARASFRFRFMVV
jgi:hypothetical protein